MRETKTKTRFKIVLIFFAVLFTAQACNFLGGPNQSEERIVLTWWKPFDDPRVVQPLIEDFQKAFPNVQIKYVQKNIETYEDELLDALASGTGPDIFSIHNDWLPRHKEKISPAPTTLLSLREFRESFAQVVAEDLVSEERVYGLPLALDVLALYYNKDILASAGIPRPPATWQELITATEKITRQDNLGNFTRSAIAFGTADNINRASDILALLMLQNNTPFYAAGRTQSTLDQTVRDESGKVFSPGARAVEFYTQFANPASTAYTWNNRSNNSIEAFGAGSVAMILSYAYLQPVLKERAPFLNYAVTGVPQIERDQNRINFANYWAEAVAKKSMHQDAAWQFLKFITSGEVLSKYYEIQKAPSSRIDILEQQIRDPVIGVFAENALSAKSLYKPDSDALDRILAQIINDVILRNATPSEAVRAAAQKVNLLLRNK